MDLKLHQNAILTGYMDAYCLLCESLLRAEDTFTHINKPIHKKNLDAAPYIQKYKDDFIRKVKKGYYCVFCNILFTTVTKVKLHIAEATHIQNRGALIVKRVGNMLIALNDICINEKAWHGLLDDVCALCNLEFTDENIHKTEQNHVLNLIQKRVEFLDKKAVYRMVDNESFQCLTCNMIVALGTIETHFNEDHHKKIFQKCRIAQSVPPINVQQNDETLQKKLGQVQKVIENAKPKDTPKEVPKKLTLGTSNTQQTEKKSNEENDDNMKTNKSEPKHKSKTNVNLTVNNEEAMGQDMKPNFDQNHNDTDKKQSTKEEESENVTLNLSEGPKDLNHTFAVYSPTGTPKETLSKIEINVQAKFAKEHDLTYNRDNGNAYCRLCSVRLPASLISMKEHVNGMNHKNKAKAQTTNIPKNTAMPKNRTIPMHLFVRDACLVPEGRDYVMVLNNKFCLSMFSFMMITHNMNRIRCQACEVNVTDHVNMVQHLATGLHNLAMDNTPVVQNLDDEFVREVRPGLFHCGFCNLIVGVWKNVSLHLQCKEHGKNKEFANRRLQVHLPYVLENQRIPHDLRLFLDTISTDGRKRDLFLRFMHGMF